MSGSPLNVNQVLLKADTGKYLSRVERSFGNPLEASKSQPDPLCWFTVIKNGDGSYSLLADNSMYFTRVDRDTHNVQAAKTFIDYPSRFTMIEHGDGTISLRSDRGKYLSRISREGCNPIEAVKDTIDIYCKFTITEVEVAGAKFLRM